MRAALFYPMQATIGQAAQRADILGQQNQTDWQHPQAEYRQDEQEAAKDQKNACRDAHRPRRGLPQPMHQCLRALGKTANQ
jgi:hypothetical protein